MGHLPLLPPSCWLNAASCTATTIYTKWPESHALPKPFNATLPPPTTPHPPLPTMPRLSGFFSHPKFESLSCGAVWFLHMPSLFEFMKIICRIFIAFVFVVCQQQRSQFCFLLLLVLFFFCFTKCLFFLFFVLLLFLFGLMFSFFRS